MSGRCPNYNDMAWFILISVLLACVFIFIAGMMIYGVLLYAESDLVNEIAWEYVPVIGIIIFIVTIATVLMLGTDRD